MDANPLHSSLKPLYKTYNEVIKPLIADIEARGQQFPLPLFNEIRAFNDHVAQCYWEDSTDVTISAEIHKAERHIVRIVLDCYKYLVLFLNDKIEVFEKQTRKIDLTVINNGIFYIQYRKLKKEAVEMVRESKRIESKNNGGSIKKFELAYNLYTELEDLIDAHNVEFKWARVKFTFRKALKIGLWLFAAIISGLISLFISCPWLKDFLNSAFSRQ
ncbi:MAG TPA: hypothetical protein VJ963_15165 [Bacteroidales bacterium]|nr:hypothetical protein [Bacteroidales bacterium]